MLSAPAAIVTAQYWLGFAWFSAIVHEMARVLSRHLHATATLEGCTKSYKPLLSKCGSTPIYEMSKLSGRL